MQPTDLTKREDEEVNTWDEPQVFLGDERHVTPYSIRGNRTDKYKEFFLAISDAVAMPNSISGILADSLFWLVGTILVHSTLNVLLHWGVPWFIPLGAYIFIVLLLVAAFWVAWEAGVRGQAFRTFTIWRIMLVFIGTFFV